MERAVAYCTLSSLWIYVADVQGAQAGADYSITLRCVAMYTVRRSFLCHPHVDPPNVRRRFRRCVGFWHVALTWSLNVRCRSNRITKKVGVGFLFTRRPSIDIVGCLLCVKRIYGCFTLRRV